MVRARLLAMVASTIAVLLPSLPGWAAESNELIRATSVSRQFTAHAPGPVLPHALCVFAEQVRREWADILNLGPDWRDPIILTVRERTPDELTTRSPIVGVAKTEFHLKFSILYLTPPELDQNFLVNALAEALCGEWANRRQPVSREAAYIAAPIPPWISLGLSRLVRGRDERLLRLVQRSISSDRPPAALRMLTAADVPTDVMDRQLFEATASIMVEALLQLPDGPRRLRGFLTECGETKSAWRAFWISYRDQLPDEAAVERWWAVQVASQTRLVPAQNLTTRQSREVLQATLDTSLSITDSPAGTAVVRTVPLAEFWRYHDAAWFDTQLSQKLIRLAALRQQVSPVYREVIEEYLTALRWLEQRYFNRFRRALRIADAHAERVNQAARGVSEYLDRIETTHGTGLSPASVNNFFQAIESLELHNLRRRSPISDYLDQFDQ